VNKPEDLQLQIERGNAPALADFAAWFDQWVVEFNAGHAHQGQGMDGLTPDQVYRANLHTVRTAQASLLDLLCLRKIGPVKVGQNGVTVDGLQYGQFEPSLQRLLGRQVVLRVDERDVSRVQVYDLDDRFVCLAPSNVAVPFGAGKQELREAMGAKRQAGKLLKDYTEQRPRMADDVPDIMLRQAAERAAAAKAANPEPPPGPNIRPVRHTLEEQLDAVQRASEAAQGRRAVGAESVPLPSRLLMHPLPAEPASGHGTAEVVAPSFRQLMAGAPRMGGDGHE
jgi:putative transposase